MQKFHNKPKCWQDFELLCAHLWKAEFKCQDISRHGRQGQKQHGVDVYGNKNNGNELFGIQCKGKDEYNHSQITKREIDVEINKALTFKPNLSLFIFATTSTRDEEIQEYIRIKDLQYFNSHKMHISIKFWDCIEELLDYHGSVKAWYEGRQTESYNVEVDLIDNNLVLEPRFNKMSIKYELPNKYCVGNIADLLCPAITDIMHQKQYINHTFCEFDIYIQNTGESVIEDYCLRVNFDKDEVRAVSNMNDRYTNNIWDYEINKIKAEKNELFHCDDDCSLEFDPKKCILVQKDNRQIKIGIFPLSSTKVINIKWNFIARDFSKEGTLKIPVHPHFVAKSERRIVLYESEVRTEEIIEEGLEYIDDDFEELL